MPTGFDSKSDLPTGITFVGNFYDEGTILQIAKLYQDNSQWNKKHPTLFN